MSCSSLNNYTDDERLKKLGFLEIKTNKTYVSKLIEDNIKNAFDIYNTKSSGEKKYTPYYSLKWKIIASVHFVSINMMLLYYLY